MLNASPPFNTEDRPRLVFEVASNEVQQKRRAFSLQVANTVFRLVLILVFPSVLLEVAAARVWRVTVDHAGDAPSIQAAMDSAKAGDVVQLAPGTYTWTAEASTEHSMVVFKREVSLIGEAGRDSTILDAESSGRALLLLDVGIVRVEGITIRRGFGKGGSQGSHIVMTHGAGVYSWGDSDPRISNCKFIENRTFPVSNGAGIYLHGNGTIEGSEFIANQGGQDASGAGVYCTASATIRSCRFVGNQVGGDAGASAPAVSAFEALIEDCWFEGNGCSGYAGAGSGAVTVGGGEIRRCVFIGNTTRASAGPTGGAAITCGGALVTECTILLNKALSGSAVAVGGIHGSVECTISRSTIAWNEAKTPLAGFDVGGVYLRRGGTLSQTIVAMNVGRAAFGLESALLSCNNLFGNTNDDLFGEDGGGNFSLSPVFCGDPTADFDVSIQESSPCAPGNHPDGDSCGLIGAGAARCPPTAVRSRSWGEFKKLFGGR